MRLARAATGRTAILKFEGAFHGSNDYALMSVTPRHDRAYPTPEPDSLGIPAALEHEVLVAPFNDVATTQSIVGANADRLAAIIVEPVQRAIAPEPGFLQALRRLATQYGIVLIFDEVVTGFRLALGGAQELFGVVPDVATYGKAVAGGYPLAAIAGTRAVMETVTSRRGKPAYVSGTLAGNPIAAAAGVATLEVLRRPGTYEYLFSLGSTMRAALEDALAGSQTGGKLLGIGPMFQVLLKREGVVAQGRVAMAMSDYRAVRDFSQPLGRLSAHFLRRGVLYTGRKGYLSLAHGSEDVSRVAECAAEWAAIEQ
jgi:glutamate-1-semialdehyde 2,1-aminomutase